MEGRREYTKTCQWPGGFFLAKQDRGRAGGRAKDLPFEEGFLTTGQKGYVAHGGLLQHAVLRSVVELTTQRGKCRCLSCLPT